MTFGWGIVGAGAWGDRVIAPAIKQAKDARLVAVFSRDQARADAIAAGHGAEKGYASLEAFLRHPGLDAVYVATPNNVRAASVIPAARAGKHVLQEVSMAVTEEDCLAMIEAARRAKVKLGSAYQTRHHPANRDLKQLIDDGSLGDLVMIRVQMGQGGTMGARRSPFTTDGTVNHPRAEWKLDPDARGGGALVGTGKFPIDLLRFLSGREVDEVFAYSDAATAPRGQESYVMAMVHFQGNLVAMFDNYGPDYAGTGKGVRSPYSDNGTIVYGTRGRASCYGAMQVAGGDAALEAVTERGTFRREYTGHNVFVNEIESFQQAVQNDLEPSGSGVDGWRERMIGLAMIESSLKGIPIKLRT